METITLKTDIHCQGCIDAIKPIFDEDESIKNWTVDLGAEVKTLTVIGDAVSVSHVDHLLKQSGYNVLTDDQPSFWGDRPLWSRATFNTLNCLIGCSIGDFGMIFYLQAFYPDTAMIWQMVLAIIAGLCTSIILETVLLKYREHFSWLYALKVAFGMSFISMVAMELAMTGTDFMITGGKAAFSDPVYWLALIPALIVGFLTPLPYNYYKLKKYNKACH
ncbi:MAG: DUF4396 domain-containing protein [Cyclobacteriaceae bacterium]|nr:DUF4396 domain-containing protein [Cyclobacteriaceae bacterium HetDA_MAG_MS6]